MNFSAWSIRNPIAPLLAFGLLLYVGLQSFFALPITRFPNIDVPVVSVTVVQSGASPAELEMQVTKEIEDAVASISGIDEIQSTVTDGQSLTTIVFRIEKPTEEAVQDTKDQIDKIRSDLPAGIEEPIVSKVDVEGQAIQTFAVSSPNMTLEELSWFVDDTITRDLQGKPGIGRIDRYGGADREVRVALNPAKLDAYGITAADVNTGRRQRADDPHARRRSQCPATCRYQHRALERPFRQTVRTRAGDRYLRGAEILLALQRHAVSHLRRLPRQGCKRSLGGGNRCRGPGRHPQGASRCHDRDGR